MYTLNREIRVRTPIGLVFDFFSKAENLERLTPPWLHFRILTPLPISMHSGTTIDYQLRVRGIPIKWSSEIEVWHPPFEFVDVHRGGPYKEWRHTHRFSEVENGTKIVDSVDYALPFGPLGKFIHWLQVSRDLGRIFDYRECRVHELLD